MQCRVSDCYRENYVQLPQEFKGLNGTINTIIFCTFIILQIKLTFISIQEMKLLWYC